jgi:hypothetical protein
MCAAGRLPFTAPTDGFIDREVSTDLNIVHVIVDAGKVHRHFGSAM